MLLSPAIRGVLRHEVQPEAHQHAPRGAVLPNQLGLPYRDYILVLGNFQENKLPESQDLWLWITLVVVVVAVMVVDGGAVVVVSTTTTNTTTANNSATSTTMVVLDRVVTKTFVETATAVMGAGGTRELWEGGRGGGGYQLYSCVKSGTIYGD